MKQKRILMATLVLGLLLSLTVGIGQAQEPGPQVEEPGSVPGIDAPPEGEMSENAAMLATAFSGGPDYDSGWVSLAQGESKTLTHNLGGNIDNYVVDMQYKSSDVSNGVNQRYYGGADFGANVSGKEDNRVGAYWRSLTTSSIIVYRRPEDTYAEQVRVRIWVDPYPDWDSGWVSLTAGAASTTLNHNLGGSADDYVVDMQYKSSSSGVNQRYYGGADFGATAFNGTREDERVGVYWRSLTTSSITLFRRAEDDYAPEVRIRIWIRPTPAYDSGWVPVNQNQARTLVHNIGGDPDDYVVYMEYQSSGSGTNQRYYGGVDFGANPPGGMNADDRVGVYWRKLTGASITVYRRPEDIYAVQVRVRIWNFWQPPVPNYDSGWVSLGAGAASTTLTHNLGGSTDDYFVDMQYKSSNVSSGVNQRYYGGADFGANVSGKNNNRVGAYWRSLTTSTIIVFRRAEDSYASEVRVRIWRMPRPDYDSYWISLTAGAAATTLAHNLGGSTGDYLVDMQYKSSDYNGVNQRHYGGVDFGANPPGGMNEDDRVGAYWRSLTATSITVYRRPEDVYAGQVRVRIWRMAAPDYDTGWTLTAQDASKTFTHNLGGDPRNYLVTMWQFDTGSSGVNQRHYGGADFGTNPPGGYSADDRIGTYWRTLTNSGITVYRRHEDGFADYLRVRIWVTPYQVYLPLVTKNY